MKFRQITLLVILTFILSACNFTLAEDVTPPPGYVPPTPMPTLGPLFPENVPDLANGASIYAAKCEACHGTTGMGDGPQGIQLGVTVTAYGLPDVARGASPAQWYEVVTRGRMDRFMPPFASLNDQQRWDVVAYITTLHTTPEQVEQGKALFEANCANCTTDYFHNQEKMSALTEVELARLIKEGNADVPAFGANLTDNELWAVSAYLRSLSFETTLAAAPAPTNTPETIPATATVVPTDAGTPVTEGTPSVSETPSTEVTPSVEGTPVESTPQAEVTNEPTATAVALQPGFGTVSGTIDNQTGVALPTDQKVTLHGYQHGSDPNAGLQEVLTLDTTVNADETYTFNNVEMPANRIFVAEMVVNGMSIQSGFMVVAEGDTSITVPPIQVFDTTTDTSKLVIDEVHQFIDYADTDIQFSTLYIFRNTGDKAIFVEAKNGTDISFMKTPEGATSLGYEAWQGGEQLVTADNGFTIPPSDNGYGLIHFASMPKAKQMDVTQAFAMPVATFSLYIPEGTKAEGSRLTDHGVQTMDTFTLQTYAVADIQAGDTIKFTLSGTPSTTPSTTADTTNSNQNLLIGLGALGGALILAGAWLYLRDRKRLNEEEEEDEATESAEFESTDEVMDAIITLDDQHRAKKISDEAYQKRRAELKDILKGMM